MKWWKAPRFAPQSPNRTALWLVGPHPLCRAPLALLLMLVLAACSEQRIAQPPPQNQAPTIRRQLPEATTTTDTAGKDVTLRYVVADKERLASWRLILEAPAGDTLLVNAVLQGTYDTVGYTYRLPDLPHFSQLTMVAVVEDFQGATDTTRFPITVLNPQPEEQPYAILDYSGDPDTLYNARSVTNRGAFNLIQKRHTTSGPSSRDLQDETTVSTLFAASWSSPNNAQDGFAEPFVVVSPSLFNYQGLTYTTMSQAWQANDRVATTGRLQVGDIVILRLTLPPSNRAEDPHYAAIRIREVYDSGPADDDDYIVFDYKRSAN